MDWDKKYEKILSDLKQYSETRSSCKESPSYKDKCIVEDILKNGENYNEAKWNEVYQQCKKNFALVNFMINEYDVPQSVIKEVILDNAISYQCIEKILSRELDDDVLDMLYDNNLSAIETCLRYHQFDKSEYTLNYLAKRIYYDDEAELEMSKSRHGSMLSNKKTDAAIQILSQFNSEKLAQMFYDENMMSEFKNSLIISNENLSDEMRKKFFDMEYNYEYISKATNEIKQEMYRSFVESVDEVNGLSREEQSLVYRGLRDFFYKICSKRLTTEAIELDIAHRIMPEAGRSQDYILDALFRNTKYNSVLKIGTTSKSRNTKEIVYENKHMSEALLNERVHDLCKKIKKAMSGLEKDAPSYMTPYSDTWIKAICGYCKSAVFSDEDYDTLLSLKESKLKYEIAASPTTPIHILNKIIDGKDRNVYDAPYIAAVMKFGKEQGISEEQRLEFVRNYEINNYGSYSTYKKEKPFARLIEAYDIFFEGKDQQEEFRKILSHYKETQETESGNTRHATAVTNEFDQYVKIKQALRNKDYDALPKEYLSELRNEMLTKFYVNSFFYLYSCDDATIDKYNNIVDILEEKEKEEEKEKAGCK